MSDITTRVELSVYYSDTPTGEEALVVGAQVDTVAFACAPAVDSAQFTYPYGWIDGAARANIDFRDKFIRIRMEWANGSIFSWYGYCHEVENRVIRTQTVAGVEIPTGDTVCRCASRAKQLGERRISGSFTRAGFVNRPLPFNLPPCGRSTEIVGNRAFTKLPGDDHYAFTALDGDTWTALEALKEVLAVWTEETGIDTYLDGQYSALDYYSYHWEQAGKTYWQLINEIVSPGRGFVLYAVQNNDGSLTFLVTTASSTTISLDEYSVLPASAYQIDALNIAESELVEPPVLHRLPAAHKVIVRGEPLKLCMTLGYIRNNLVAGWDAADVTAYAAATADERKSDDYKDIFQRFVIPPEWDGESYIDGASRKTLPAISPYSGRCNLESTTSGYAYVSQTAYVDDAIVDKDIPIYRRDDHQPRPLAAWLDYDLYWIDITSPPAGAKGVHVSPLDDGMGVRIQPPVPHYYGYDHSAVGGEKYDWQNLLFTVAFDTNDIARVQKTISTPAAGAIERVRTLDIPDLHVWYILPGTIKDAYGATTVESSGEYARDDSPILRYIAEIAAFWYGQDRTQFDLKWNYAPDLMYIGHLIVQSEIAGSIVPTGTVITSITYSFRGDKHGAEQQTCTWATEWFDLDLERIFSRGRGSRSRAGHAPTNYPAALANPDSGGGGIPAKITSGGPGADYTGALHANGIDEAATETGVSITVFGVAAGETLAANYPLLVTPIGDHYEGSVSLWQ